MQSSTRSGGGAAGLYIKPPPSAGSSTLSRMHVAHLEAFPGESVPQSMHGTATRLRRFYNPLAGQMEPASWNLTLRDNTVDSRR